jgi:hypothetical protein
MTLITTPASSSRRRSGTRAPPRCPSAYSAPAGRPRGRRWQTAGRRHESACSVCSNWRRSPSLAFQRDRAQAAQQAHLPLPHSQRQRAKQAHEPLAGSSRQPRPSRPPRSPAPRCGCIAASRPLCLTANPGPGGRLPGQPSRGRATGVTLHGGCPRRVECPYRQNGRVSSAGPFRWLPRIAGGSVGAVGAHPRDRAARSLGS